MKTFALATLITLSLSTCVSNPNSAALTALGGIGGGVGCSHIGQGNGRLAASVGCALLGAFAGNHIGSKFDNVSHNQSAINQLHSQQQQLQHQQQLMQQRLQQSRTHSTTHNVYGGVAQSHSHNLGMNCSVRNNYVVCNGTR